MTSGSAVTICVHIAVVFASVVAACYLDVEIIKKITSELISFYTIQAAIILPAMIFTAGILRADALTEAEAVQYQEALKLQMTFWVTLLTCDFIAVIMLIFGKALDWHIEFVLIGYPVRLTWLAIGITSAAVLLSIVRVFPFVSGVRSLLELNGTLVIKSIRMRDGRDARTVSRPPIPFETPEDYGKVVTR
jgi:hypothetical protein